MFKEQLLAFDKFNMPAEIEGGYAKAVLIMRLILLRKGTYQNSPDCGVGLVDEWRYVESTKLSELERVIQNQLAQYLPEIYTNNIRVYYRDKILIIEIETEEETIYIGTEDFSNVSIYDIINKNN